MCVCVKHQLKKRVVINLRESGGRVIHGGFEGRKANGELVF